MINDKCVSVCGVYLFFLSAKVIALYLKINSNDVIDNLRSFVVHFFLILYIT